ncbi:hypothetical protein NPIL_150241 [Nephila pilipes]|uniref:Uncharacterized protein n=1 Tax=Nephila pilipes TaxID=299642 RepID=A0A8X6PTM8_NEPPI|nr:hypothetical protein NPIL_150241 [Nephila pilipes]
MRTEGIVRRTTFSCRKIYERNFKGNSTHLIHNKDFQKPAVCSRLALLNIIRMENLIDCDISCYNLGQMTVVAPLASTPHKSFRAMALYVWAQRHLNPRKLLLQLAT